MKGSETMKNKRIWLLVISVLMIVALAAPAAFAEGLMGLPVVETSRTFLPTGTADYPVTIQIYDNESNLWPAGATYMHVYVYDVYNGGDPVAVPGGDLTVNVVGEDGIEVTVTTANAQAMATYMDTSGISDYALVVVNTNSSTPVAMGNIQLYPEIQPQDTSFGAEGDTVTIPKEGTVWTHYQIWSDEYNLPVGYGDPVVNTGTISDSGSAYVADISAFTLSNGSYKLLLFESDPATAQNFGAYVPFTFEDQSIISDATVYLSTNGVSNDYSSSARADVTEGYADVRIVIEDTYITSGTYKIQYDSTKFSAGLNDWSTNLTTEPTVTQSQISNDITELTVDFAGTVNAIDTTETLFTLRFTASSEGTLPLYVSNMFEYGNGLAESGVQLFNDQTEMSIMKDEFNSDKVYFTFTDKAMVHYFHDMNSGEALTDGTLYYVFDDQTEEPMQYSNDDNGGYFYDFYDGEKTVSSYMIDFDGYEDMAISSTEHYHNTSEIQPVMLWTDPHMLPLTTEDLTITINETGIGLSVSNLIAQGYCLDDDWNSNTVDKNVTFAMVDSDTVNMTIVGGLSDFGDMAQYNFYITDTGNEGGLLGRALLTVDDQSANQDPYDLDMSGTVDIADLALLAQNFGIDSTDQMYWGMCDLNGDNIIDIFDLVLLAKEIN